MAEFAGFPELDSNYLDGQAVEELMKECVFPAATDILKSLELSPRVNFTCEDTIDLPEGDPIQTTLTIIQGRGREENISPNNPLGIFFIDLSSAYKLSDSKLAGGLAKVALTEGYERTLEGAVFTELDAWALDVFHFSSSRGVPRFVNSESHFQLRSGPRDYDVLWDSRSARGEAGMTLDDLDTKRLVMPSMSFMSRDYIVYGLQDLTVKARASKAKRL